MSEWELVAILPNLYLVKPIGNEFLALVEPDDSRVQSLASPAVAVLLSRFTDTFKRRIRPSALIVRRNEQNPLSRDAIVAFRNAVAISTIVYGWANLLNGGQVNPPIWSDTFSFHPVFARSDGYLGASTPSLGMIDTTDDFAGQTSPLLARNICEPVFDHALYDALFERWRARYTSGVDDESTARLFRSLQTAFASATVPYDNLGSLSDFGVRVGLWASAFEILAHPGKKGVTLQHVVEMLNDYRSGSAHLSARADIHWKKDRVLRGNVPAQLYWKLSRIRNNFVHGNALADNIIYADCDRSKPAWNSVAPILYWCALRSHLAISPLDVPSLNIGRAHMDHYTLDHALQAIVGKLGR